MRRLVMAAVAASIALVGCQGGGDVMPSPSEPSVSPSSVAPSVVTTSPAAPDPGPTPTVDTSSLPSVSGWSQRPQTVDEEAASPDVAWASERDVEEIMQIWASYACTDRSQLPTPGRVVEGAFTTPDGAPAVVEVVSFDDEADASSFVSSYLAGSVDCGATAVSDDAVARPIDGDVWTEIVTAAGPTAHVTVVQQELDADEVAAIVAEFA